MFDLEQASSAARAAQFSWANTTWKDRLKHLREFRFLLTERRDELAKIVQQEVGRDPDEFLASEILPTLSAVQFLLSKAKTVLKPRPLQATPFWLRGTQGKVERTPWGVVGLIGTWNYPVFINLVPLLQAVTAGNALLWKPSEQVALTSKWLHALVLESGFPADLVQCLPSERHYGEQLLQSNIDYLHFTGSETIGLFIAQQLGKRLLPSTLELSGVDAMIIRPDANLLLAAEACFWGMSLNQGQTCMASRRLFVHESIHDEFLGLLRQLVARSSQTPSKQQLQLESQTNLMNEVLAEALAEGAELFPPLEDQAATSGSKIVSPRILLHAHVDMKICRQPIFAPLLAILRYRDTQELIHAHEKCSFGLTTSLFGRDRHAMERLAHQLRVGSVVMNDLIAPTAHPDSPFGGVKKSGWNVSQGQEGLLAMTFPKVIYYRSGRFRPHIETAIDQIPAGKEIVSQMIEFGHHRRLGRRILALVKMLQAFVRYRRVNRPDAEFQ